MPAIRRYGPSMVAPEVMPNAQLGRGREQSFAVFESVLSGVNKFIRPAVETVQTARGEQEALSEVQEKGPRWGLRQLQSTSSSIAISPVRPSGKRGGKDPAHVHNSGGHAGGPLETPGDFVRYSHDFSGKIRNKPISDRLYSALSFLPDMGIEMEVFSGGQDAKGKGKRRTGSTRHDGGDAADARFFKDGRMLDWDRPEDVPIFQEIVRRARANGVTGFGAGHGYMSQGSMHIGFGSAAVWGDNGDGDNAPQWLREAFGGHTGADGTTVVPGVGGAVTVNVPGTPEFALETLNNSTFEPRLPFTVRDAAFNKSADRVIGARAATAMEEGMRAAMQRADGDINKLNSLMSDVRSQVMAQVPPNLPGIATDLQVQFDRGLGVAQRQAATLATKRVMQQQSQTLNEIGLAAQQEAERLALTGATSAELADHMAQATDIMAQFGPREGFTVAGRSYPPDPSRAGIMTPQALADHMLKIGTDSQKLMLEADFMRSDAPGQYVDEFRKQVFSGNSPLPAGESLAMLRKFEVAARQNESARRVAADRERKRLEQDMDATINAYVSMSEAGVPVAIPEAEREQIRQNLSPYPKLLREAEIAFQVADAQVQTHGMNGNELRGYVAQIRADMAAASERGELDLGGAAIIADLEDELKALQDGLSAEVLGLPLIEQLAQSGSRVEDVDYDGLKDRAAGDPDLVKAIREVELFHGAIEQLEGLTAAEREREIERTRAGLAELAAQGRDYGAGALMTSKVLDKLDEWSEHRQELAEKDVMKFAQTIGLELPGFGEAEDMRGLASVISQRVEMVAPYSAAEGVETPAPMTQAEIDGISEAFENSSRAQRVEFLAEISKLGEDQALAVFEKIGRTEPTLFAAGSVYTMGNQRAAGVILRGSGGIKVGGGTATDVAAARASVLDGVFSADIIAPESVDLIDATALAYARGAAMGDGGRDITQNDLEAGYRVALGEQEDGTGGVVETRYGATVVPSGWTARRLKRAIGAIDDEALSQIAKGIVTDSAGRVVSARDLRRNIEALRPSPEDPNILVPLGPDGGVFLTDDGATAGILQFDLRELD